MSWYVSGKRINLHESYTSKNIFYESGKREYESGGVKIEENFSYRPTWFSIILIVSIWCGMLVVLYFACEN